MAWLFGSPSKSRAVIFDMLIRALLEPKAICSGPWRPNFIPGITAIVAPLDKYIQERNSLFLYLDVC